MTVANRAEIPIPPTANRLWRVVNGRPVKSRQYRAWLESAGLAVKLVMRPVRGTVRVRVEVRGGKGFIRSRDVDNLIKPVIDCLRHAGILVTDNVSAVVRVEAEYLDRDNAHAAQCFVSVEPSEGK